MQPKPSLIETQKALATAVRLAHAQPLNGYAPNRLAVYARLVRNNIFGFIDRCFVEAPKHVSAESWSQTKETFVLTGKSHSPYFQDIAGEFLLFCQEKESFDANILALMDFENTQLLAEVSLAKVPEKFEWNKYLSLIHISEPTRLGMISYAVFCLKKNKQYHERARSHQCFVMDVSIIHISEPTRLGMISYTHFCLKKKT